MGLWSDEFGGSFQRVLVRACVTDAGLRSIVARFHASKQLAFSDPSSAWVWRVIASSDSPTILQIETEVRQLALDDPARGGVDAILSAGDFREDEYARRRVLEWARRQVFRAGFDEAREKWNAGDADGAYTTMSTRIDELAGMRLDSADRGWFFEELDERQQRRRLVAVGDDAFPSGIDRLDQAMQGGLHYGELEIPLGYSGVGKSFYCVQRVFIAARMRRRALMYVLEGGRKKAEDRIEARFSDTIYYDVRKGEIDADRLAALRREYAATRHCIVVRGFSDKHAWNVTLDDISADIAEMRQQHGWIPQLISVDYGDLVLAPGDNKVERQANAFRGLKSIADRVEFRGHCGYAVSAPAQAQRPSVGADDREHVLRPRDIAEAYDKVR